MAAEATTRDAASPRVKVVHDQTRRTLALALAFAVAAGLATVAPHRTGAWLPLHLFLVGSLLLAISGATRLFAVTWSAGEPIVGVPVPAQRWLVAGGAAGLAAGRELAWPVPLVAASGIAVTAGLVVLGWLLLTEARTAKVRRYHAAVAFYVVAIVAGVAGTALGAAMVSGRPGLRDAHIALNVMGLVGLVIAGTLPFFLATEARMKMSRRAVPARLHRVLGWMAVATFTTAGAAIAESHVLEAIGLVAYAAGVVYVITLLPVPGRKQISWAGPRLFMLGAAVLWWTGAVAFAGVRAAAGDPAFTEEALGALVLGGYVQILVGSLAYLGPVLRGGGHRRLTNGFAVTRSWLSLIAVNVAAIAWIAGSEPLARAGVVIVVADLGWRVARLAWKAPPAPEETAPAWAESRHGRTQPG